VTPNVSPGSRVVISQIFGGGGNAEGSFSHDFIELFNAGTTDQDLTDWSLQYASASSEGAWTSIHVLSGIIKAGQYFLVQEARGANAGVELPAADAVGGLTLGSTAGKVALVNSRTLLSSSCPMGAWIDFVGYGAANCFETSPAPALSSRTAAVRTDVCAKKNDNSLEFAAFAPAPLNSMVPPDVCRAPAIQVVPSEYDVLFIAPSNEESHVPIPRLPTRSLRLRRSRHDRPHRLGDGAVRIWFGQGP
jgi:predicted extracellular nuclease